MLDQSRQYRQPQPVDHPEIRNAGYFVSRQSLPSDVRCSGGAVPHRFGATSVCAHHELPNEPNPIFEQFRPPSQIVFPKRVTK